MLQRLICPKKEKYSVNFMDMIYFHVKVLAKKRQAVKLPPPCNQRRNGGYIMTEAEIVLILVIVIIYLAKK
jgi:hypothetical protein